MSKNVIRSRIGDEEITESLSGQCNQYHWTISYVRLILLIGHSIDQSIFSLTRSKYFRDALGRVCRRTCNGCFGVRRPTKELIRQPHHPQRMRRMHRHGYNGQLRIGLPGWNWSNKREKTKKSSCNDWILVYLNFLQGKIFKPLWVR